MIRSEPERSHDRQGGVALYIALVVLVIVGATISLVSQITRRLPRQTVTERARAVALAAADGGIELARARLARQVDFEGAATTIGQCTVTVAVQSLGAARWRVVSIARHLPDGEHGLPVTRSIECDLASPRSRDVDGGGRLPAVSAWRAR